MLAIGGHGMQGRQRGVARVALLGMVAVGLPAAGLLAAAIAHPPLAIWLLPALAGGLACAALAWRGFAAGAAAATGPEPAAAVRVDGAGAGSADPTQSQQLVEMRRELDRLREVERQLTRASKEAEAATMAKGEFLATMSHEIRTPLNGIIPLLDILLSTKLADDQRDYLATAYQSAKQLLSIVDDILDYSKIEANRLELESVGLNLQRDRRFGHPPAGPQRRGQGPALFGQHRSERAPRDARRPGAAAPGADQPGRQRDQVHRRGGSSRDRAQEARRYRAPTRSCCSASATPASASRRHAGASCSSRSRRPTPRPPACTAAPGWAW